jgi:hypothetical protein
MTHERRTTMEQDKVSKLSDSQKNVWDEDGDRRKTVEQNKNKVSFGQRWDQVRPTKTIVFWSLVTSIILTMIVGFTWGGWVTGGTAQKMADDALVQRLAPICVDQFNQGPGKDQRLIEFKETSSWKRGDYIEEQGWATMPGEAEPDSQVATECAKLLVLTSQ